MSYLNDYIKPTDYGAVRKDINRILSLIHDITAQEPEDEGLQERICISSNVKLRTTSVTVGGPNVLITQNMGLQVFMFRKSIPNLVKAYSLTHTDVGILTFEVSDTKYGGAVTLDGSSYVSIAHNSILDVTDKISFGGWFYLPATDAGDTTAQTLINKDVWFLTVDPHSVTPNQIRARVVTGSAADKDVTGMFTPDAWNHIWVSWKDPDVKLYINKVLTDTDSTATGALNTNSNALTLG